MPAVSSVAASGSGISSGSGDLNAGHVVTLTLNMSEAVTVNTTGGTPTLTLNDGGTATYTGGSGSSALTFSYTVAAGQNTPDLTVSAVNLNGATIADAAGNNASLSGTFNPTGTLQIDTTAPSPPIISTDAINANNSITLTGTAEANSTLTVYDGQTVLGTTTASRQRCVELYDRPTRERRSSLYCNGDRCRRQHQRAFKLRRSDYWLSDNN